MEFLKHLEEWLHRDDLVERVWECHLEVARESDGVLIYSGDTRVNVKPYLDKTADLVATAQVDGQDLSLSKAVVKTVGQEMGRRQTRGMGASAKGSRQTG